MKREIVDTKIDPTLPSDTHDTLEPVVNAAPNVSVKEDSLTDTGTDEYEADPDATPPQGSGQGHKEDSSSPSKPDTELQDVPPHQSVSHVETNPPPKPSRPSTKLSHGQTTITGLFAAVVSEPSNRETTSAIPVTPAIPKHVPVPSLAPKLSSMDEFLLEEDDKLTVEVSQVKKELTGTFKG